MGEYRSRIIFTGLTGHTITYSIASYEIGDTYAGSSSSTIYLPRITVALENPDLAVGDTFYISDPNGHLSGTGAVLATNTVDTTGMTVYVNGLNANSGINCFYTKYGTYTLTYEGNNTFNLFEGNAGLHDVTGYTLNGTLQSIGMRHTQIQSDLNDLSISDDQYANGLSNHSFQSITQDDFINSPITLSGVTVQYLNLDNATAKLNIVCVNIVTTGVTHYLLVLPQELQSNQAGLLYRIIVKQSVMGDTGHYFMVYSGSSNRIIAPSIKTRYNDNYFLPLSTMETTEILWDGTDFLVTAVNKQEMISINAVNFPNIDPKYIQNDINKLM